MQTCLGGPCGQGEACHPPLRNAPVATPFLKDPLAPLPPTFLALLTGLWPLALCTGLWSLTLLAGLWPLALFAGLWPLAFSRAAGPLHRPGRWGSPPLLWVQGAQPLPGATESRPWPGRTRQPDLGGYRTLPGSLRPYSGLPSPSATPSAALGQPSSPLSRGSQFQSPTDGILVYIPVTKATEGHKALNYLGHMILLGQVPPPFPVDKNPWRECGL